MDTLFQLIYISTARAGVGREDCEAILQEARATNARRDITGLLIFNSRRFLQVLEGPESDVRAVYAHIEVDPRHHGLVIVGEKYLDSREFGQWAMAFDDDPGSDDRGDDDSGVDDTGGNGRGRSLLEKVDALLDRASPSTRALFQTSAKLYRGQLSID